MLMLLMRPLMLLLILMTRTTCTSLSGPGKTHLACVWLHSHCDAGVRGRWRGCSVPTCCLPSWRGGVGQGIVAQGWVGTECIF